MRISARIAQLSLCVGDLPHERRARRAPTSACLPGDGAHLRSGIIMAPSLAYMEHAYFDARTAGWSREPIVEMLIPSLVDASLAPAGKHVASLFCQHVSPTFPDGGSWDECKDGRRSDDRNRQSSCAELSASVIARKRPVAARP